MSNVLTQAGIAVALFGLAGLPALSQPGGAVDVYAGPGGASSDVDFGTPVLCLNAGAGLICAEAIAGCEATRAGDTRTMDATAEAKIWGNTAQGVTWSWAAAARAGTSSTNPESSDANADTGHVNSPAVFSEGGGASAHWGENAPLTGRSSAEAQGTGDISGGHADGAAASCGTT